MRGPSNSIAKDTAQGGEALLPSESGHFQGHSDVHISGHIFLANHHSGENFIKSRGCLAERKWISCRPGSVAARGLR